MSTHERDDDPRPEDDDETLRRKIRAQMGEARARNSEMMLQDPLYLEGVRQNLRRLRANAAKPEQPSARRPPGFNTAQFEFARAIVDGKIKVIPGPNAGANSDGRENDYADPLLQASGEREIVRPVNTEPQISMAAVALTHPAMPGTLSTTAEMATLPGIVVDRSDTEATIPAGRYADDPRPQKQVVRVEPRGSVATSALGVMKTNAMPATTGSHLGVPLARAAIGPKSPGPPSPDTAPAMEYPATALRAASSGPVARGGTQRLSSDQQPADPRITGPSEIGDGKTARGRGSAVVLVVLAVITLGYVALRAQPGPTPAAPSRTDAPSAAPQPREDRAGATVASAAPSGTIPPLPSTAEENVVSSAASVSVRATKPPGATLRTGVAPSTAKPTPQPAPSPEPDGLPYRTKTP